MKKTIFLTLLLLNISFSSTLNDIQLEDEDFLKIMHSSKKVNILDRISELMLLKKSLNDVDDDFIKLNAVNDFFNEFRFKSDKKIYNKADYWASRKEFIFKGSGDCEDFVIAKYFTLIELGVDESKLSLLHNIYRDDYHLVLAYKEDKFSDPFILDNINKTILPLTQRDDILVLFTLKTIDISNKINLASDLQALSNYKWTKVYLKYKKKRMKLFN